MDKVSNKNYELNFKANNSGKGDVAVGTEQIVYKNKAIATDESINILIYMILEEIIMKRKILKIEI